MAPRFSHPTCPSCGSARCPSLTGRGCPETEPRFIRPATAARYLGLSLANVYQMLHRRQIPYIRKRGRIWFDLDAIDRWLAANQEVPEPSQIWEACCQQCDHVWRPRESRWPRSCPRCHSRRWDRPLVAVAPRASRQPPAPLRRNPLAPEDPRR